MKNAYLNSIFISRLHVHTIQKTKQKYIVIFIFFLSFWCGDIKNIFLKKYYFNIFIHYKYLKTIIISDKIFRATISLHRLQRKPNTSSLAN